MSNKMTESFPKHSKDFYKTILMKNESSEWLAKSDVTKEVMANDKDKRPIVVLLTDSRNMDEVKEILHTELSKDFMSRLFIICFERGKLSRKVGYRNKVPDNIVGIAVQESPTTKVPNLIDDFCEKYAYKIVESMAKALYEVYIKFYDQPSSPSSCQKLSGFLDISSDKRKRRRVFIFKQLCCF